MTKLLNDVITDSGNGQSTALKQRALGAPTSKELQRMCDAIGVSKQTLFNIRDNRSFPSVGTIMALATHYKIDINALLSGQPLNQAYGADEPVQKATPTVKQPEPVSLDMQKAIELAKLQVENEQLKERLDMLKDQVEELRNEKNALYVQLFAFDPTDPNSSNLGHKRQNMLRSKIARKTAGQLVLNRDHSIKFVSKVLGHKSIATTEKYYVRANLDTILGEL